MSNRNRAAGVASSVESAAWASGYGVVRHTEETRNRISTLAEQYATVRSLGDGVSFYELLSVLDRLTSAALWLVVHQTYAQSVYLEGRPLAREDFKSKPDGHTGGSLNMVPAYAGYLAANVLTAHTRGWLMGQGHCVSAIDSLAESISVSRVLFPADFNSAAAVTASVFETPGQIWTLVVPKADGIPDLVTPAEAKALVADGGVRTAIRMGLSSNRWKDKHGTLECRSED